MDSVQPDDLRANLRTTYNQYAQERDTYTIQPWKSAERAKFLALLQQEQRQSLLEIGSGPGHDSQFFQEQGLDPVCIDLSPTMVALCRQKGLAAYEMDMTDIRLPDSSFDAVYAMNSLLHLPKVEFPVVLAGVARLLKPGGLFFLGVYGGYEHEGVWEKDAYRPQRFFSFFTDERLLSEVARFFDLVEFTPVCHEPGSPLHFQSLILRKAAQGAHA